MTAAPTTDVDSEPRHTVRRDVRVRMRDGVHLGVDVYLPAQTDGPVPALYAVAPYRKDLAHLPAVPTFRWRETGPIDWYVAQGYAYVLADARGSGTSEGMWRLLDDAEQHDLYDMIEWIAAQEWCTGRVGMIGQSYYALVQWHAAAQHPPHLAAIAPFDGLTDLYREAAYHGGIYSTGFLNVWHSTLRANHLIGGPEPVQADSIGAFDFVADAMRHPTDDAFWQDRTPAVDTIEVPTYSIGVWDSVGLHLRGNLEAFARLRGPKKLRVVSGDAQRLFASPAFHAEVLKPWYDHWLTEAPAAAGRDVTAEPAVQLAVRGAEPGTVRTATAWPPPDAEPATFYLHAGPTGVVRSRNDGALSTTPPTEAASSTSITYPDPAWDVGTAIINDRGIPNAVARILTFTTAPLDDDLEIAGPIVLVLYLSTDQTDTDVFVRVWDQRPMRRLQRTVQRRLVGDVAPPSTLVSRGWLKASHRALDADRSRPDRPYHTHREPVPLTPGEVHELAVEVWPAAHRFAKGNHIRIDLAPGDSPVADAPFTHYYGLKCGTDTIHHDVDHPSHLRLPVVRSGRG